MLNKITSNTLAQIFSKIGTALISIFLLSILTNYLSIELFGLYSKIYNYLGIFAFLADLGLYTIAIREITHNEKDSQKIIGNIMTLRLGLGIVILFLALAIAYFLPGYNSNLAMSGIFIISIFTIFSLLNSSILSLMQAKMKIEFSLISTIAGKLLNIFLIISVVFLVFPKENLVGSSFDIPFLYILVAGLAGIILNTWLNFRKAKQICPLSFQYNPTYIKHIFKISIPYGIALFLSVIYFKIDIIILSLIEKKSQADISIALYSLPMKIVEVLMIMGGFYMNSLLPSLTKLFKEKKTKKIQKMLQISFKVLFSSSLIIFILGSLFRENIIDIIANQKYLSPDHIYNSADALFIVLLVIIFYFISLLFIYIFIASKNQSKLLKINIFITIFNIVGNIILIPKYSFIGAGIITVMSQILLVGLGYYYSKNIVSFKIPSYFSIKIILLGIIIWCIGKYFLINFSLGLYFDIFIYGGILFGIYSFITRKSIKSI